MTQKEDQVLARQRWHWESGTERGEEGREREETTASRDLHKQRHGGPSRAACVRHMLVRVAEKKQGTAHPEESYGKGLSFVLLLLGGVGVGILTTLMLSECDSGSSSEAWEVPAEGILGPDHPLSNEVETKSEVVQEGDRETKERGAPAGDWLLRGSWRDE